MHGAVSGDHVDFFRDGALDPCQEVGVDADLEDRAALDGPGQLRVSHLVAPRTERRRSLDAQQEVGVSEPSTVEECGLEDDVVAMAHGLDGSLG